MIPNDPIVDEVRQARAALLERAGGTLESLFEYLKQQEKAAGRTPVSRSESPDNDHKTEARPISQK